MIVQVWKEVSPSLVLEATDTVLDGAHHDNSLGTSGDSNYRSLLDRLFPIVEALDQDEAEHLLRKTAMFNDSSTSVPAKRTPRPAFATDTIYDARIIELKKLAEKDAQQAIAQAATLPLSVYSARAQSILLSAPSARTTIGPLLPRAEALLGIAQNAAKSAPRFSKDALEEMSRDLGDATPNRQLEYLIAGIRLAPKIGYPDLATRLFDQSMKVTEQMRVDDTNTDDPNIGPKNWWPSTTATSRLIAAAADSISPQAGLDSIVQHVNDTDIRLVLQVSLANKELGAEDGRSFTLMRRKSGRENWSSSVGPRL